MKLSLHGLIALAGVVLAASGLAVFCPEQTRGLGLDFWNFSGAERSLRNQEARREQLNSLGEQVSRRLSLKTIVIQNLVDGQLSLGDATNEFVTLNRIEPEIMTMTRALYPSSCDEESAALQVLHFVEANFPKDDPKFAKLMARLQAEFGELKKEWRASVL